MNKQLVSQQLRKAHETVTVQRLTTWIGATALSLAGFFSVLAAKGAPVAFGFEPTASLEPQPAAGNLVNGALDDRIVVRRVYVPAARPPAGGLKAGTPQAASGTQPASTGQVTTVSSAAAPTTTTATTSAAPAPATPKPVAATGGSTPKH